MSAQHLISKGWARWGFVFLCLMLTLSVIERIGIYNFKVQESGILAQEIGGDPVDLGEGTLLPRADAMHRTVSVDSCQVPINIDFITVGPQGPNPSMVGAPRPTDRTYYMYHGIKFDGWFVIVQINAYYLVRRAYDKFLARMNYTYDDIALKIIVPAVCDTSTDELMKVLRESVQIQKQDH